MRMQIGLGQSERKWQSLAGRVFCKFDNFKF